MVDEVTMIGSHLKRLRDDANLTQEQLARALGFKRQSSISAIECGSNDIGAGDLARWLDVVGASQEDRIKALSLAGRRAPSADSAEGAA